MKEKLTRGFTLIELLVVIAIIGILASVVLASLNTARDKGADAAIKSTINNTRAEAELYYDGNSNSYANLCGTLTDASNAVNSAGGSWSCSAAAEAYRISSQLKGSTDYYCVDSTGDARTVTSAPSGNSC